MPSSFIPRAVSRPAASKTIPAATVSRVRIGIDSYSYHRLLGELRPGEAPPARRFVRGTADVLAHAVGLGVDGVSLETCFLGPPHALDAKRLRAAAGELELVFAWGHPSGLAFGTVPGALDDLLDWLDVSAAVEARRLRLVVGSPRLRGVEPVESQLERTAPLLALACDRAESVGLTLAIENHGDLSTPELTRLLAMVDRPILGVCFDTANALRVGDDPVEAARTLAPLIRMVHLKDVEPLAAVRDPVAGPRSVAFGEGVIAVAEILAILAAAGNDGLVCVEIAQLGRGADEIELVERCVRWLRDYASSKG